MGGARAERRTDQGRGLYATSRFRRMSAWCACEQAPRAGSKTSARQISATRRQIAGRLLHVPRCPPVSASKVMPPNRMMLAASPFASRCAVPHRAIAHITGCRVTLTMPTGAALMASTARRRLLMGRGCQAGNEEDAGDRHDQQREML